MPLIELQDRGTREKFPIYYKNGATIKQLKDILKSKGYKPGMELYYYDDDELRNVIQDVVDISTLNEPGKPLVVVGDMVPAAAPVPAPAPEMSSDLGDTSPKIRVTIKIVEGQTTQIYPLLLGISNTVREVKGMIQSKMGIPVDEQRLIFSGEYLEDDDRRLAEYNITLGQLHNITVRRVTKADERSQSEQTRETLLIQMDELNKLPQRHAREMEQLRERYDREMEELRERHDREMVELRQRKADLERRIQESLMDGGNRVRRRRNSRKTKQTRKRRSLKRRSLKKRSHKRRSHK